MDELWCRVPQARLPSPLQTRHGMQTTVCTTARAPSPPRVRRLKLDGSIGCQRQDASCVQAEVVSPILWGPSGLESVFDAVGAIKPLRPSVNRSTGMHVHVSARRPRPRRALPRACW